MKQSIKALSMCEAEYIAVTAAVQQTAWLRRTLQDIRMLSPHPSSWINSLQFASRETRDRPNAASSSISGITSCLITHARATSY